jgi:predicted transcriptional regulator
MKIAEIVKILNCKVMAGEEDLDTEVKAGCGCDLMSDVLAFIKPNSILLTGLNNAQAIRTAEIADINAICLVRGKQPTEEMIAMAKAEGIVLLTTSLPLFEACGKLYLNGLSGSFNY